MLTVPIRGRAAEACRDDERAVLPDDADHVAQHLAAAPLRAGFLERLREAVVHGAGEELLAAVQAASLQQLLGADDAERFEQLGADDVLAAFTAIERQIRHPRVLGARQCRNQRRVLVVGVGAGMKGAGGGLEPAEQEREPGGAAVVDGTDLCGARTGDDQDERDDEKESAHVVDGSQPSYPTPAREADVGR